MPDFDAKLRLATENLDVSEEEARDMDRFAFARLRTDAAKHAKSPENGGQAVVKHHALFIVLIGLGLLLLVLTCCISGSFQ